jgi:predicted transcriptional regulator
MRTGKPLTVYLPESLSKRLEESAKRNHRTKTVQVVLALEQFLDADESAAPKGYAAALRVDRILTQAKKNRRK